MKLQKMPNPNCLLYAAAMVLNIPAEALINDLGHDGQEVIWPKQIGQLRLRGIHIQEIIDCALARGYAFLLIDKYVWQAPTHEDMPYSYLTRTQAEQRFWDHLCKHDAILIGHRNDSRNRHAVAWCRLSQKLYDPNGIVYDYSNFNAECAYLRIRSV